MLSYKMIKGGKKMPKNKRESIIYSVMMCFCMVLWMSIYNVSCAQGGLSFDSVQQGWMGMPIAYIVALCLDLLLVSKLAKGIAFRFFLKPESSERKKVLVISSCIVVPMVIFMSLFGAVEMACHTGQWAMIPWVWLCNIPKNFIMALPFELLLAGPLVRLVFRRLFPEGTALPD